MNKKNIGYNVALMFITFGLHWLFCYLCLCDLRHIYHLPIHLTVVRIKVIKVIKLMQGYLMRALRTSCQIMRNTANACFYVCESYVCVEGSVGCGLKAEHGNIMDVLVEKNNFFFFAPYYTGVCAVIALPCALSNRYYKCRLEIG